jgi:hypothetical protein
LDIPEGTGEEEEAEGMEGMEEEPEREDLRSGSFRSSFRSKVRRRSGVEESLMVLPLLMSWSKASSSCSETGQYSSQWRGKEEKKRTNPTVEDDPDKIPSPIEEPFRTELYVSPLRVDSILGRLEITGASVELANDAFLSSPAAPFLAPSDGEAVIVETETALRCPAPPFTLKLGERPRLPPPFPRTGLPFFAASRSFLASLWMYLHTLIPCAQL